MTLRYSEDHHWVRHEGQQRVRVGLSEFAQAELGDIAYLELPQIGVRAERGEPVCGIESLKSAGELYAPVTGTIVERNEALATEHGRGLVNRDPLGDGWIFVIEMERPDELEQLLSAADYARMTATE